jgi:hypothetical protein
MRRSRSNKQEHDERRWEHLRNIGAWPKPETITGDEIEYQKRIANYFTIHVCLFICGCIVLDLLTGVTWIPIYLAIHFLWPIVLSEHIFNLSRALGYPIWKTMGYGTYYSTNRYIEAIRKAQLEGLDIARAMSSTYICILGLQFTTLFIFTNMLVQMPRGSAPSILLPRIFVLFAIILGAIGFHAFTVYLRGGFRAEHRKAKPQFDGLVPGNETLRQDIVYVVSDDGELVEAAGDLGHEKRKP